MTPPVSAKNQTLFDDEISLLDIIQFFKDNFKRILFFIILGGLIGFLYGKLADPVYDGSVLVSPALVAGNYVTDTKSTLTKLKMNSYYSNETLLACNPIYYKDKDIDYDMSDFVKASITKDENLLELTMNHSNREIIHACLENIIADINAREKIIADPLIESKKNLLSLAEEKLMVAEEFRKQLNDKQIKNLKITEQRFSTDLLYALNNTSEIKELQDQINKLKTELSSEQTKGTSKALPINFERKSFPSEKLGLLLGLFLGFVLGIYISLYKKFKVR